MTVSVLYSRADLFLCTWSYSVSLRGATRTFQARRLRVAPEFTRRALGADAPTLKPYGFTAERQCMITLHATALSDERFAPRAERGAPRRDRTLPRFLF